MKPNTCFERSAPRSFLRKGWVPPWNGGRRLLKASLNHNDSESANPLSKRLWGVAPGYYLVPLQGTKNLPFGLTPRHPVSDITDSHFRLCMLRMTAWKSFSAACLAPPLTSGGVWGL